MKKRKSIFIVAAILLVVVLAVVLLAGKGGRSSKAGAGFQTDEVKIGELTALVGTTGFVKANQTAVLNWQTTGRVAKVNAMVGDRVEKEYILAELDENTLPQNVILVKAELVTARRTLDDLLNSDTNRAKAYQALVQAQKALDDALEKRESKQYSRADVDTLDVARANLVIAEDEVTKAERYYDQYDGLPDDNPLKALALSQLANTRQSRDRSLANLNWLLGRPDPQEVSEADANVEVARANLADAERAWARVKDGPNPDDVAGAQARITALEATLGLANIQAPFSGTVTERQNDPGDEVAPGTFAFRIDDLSKLLVEVEIPEVDIAQVKTGYPAKLTFDAIKNAEYKGIVVEVARVGTPAQGVVNFQVIIELTDPGEEIRPGMTSAVNIVVNQVKDALLVPNRAIRLREGRHFIYLLREEKQVEIEVQLGATSDTMSQIIGGNVNAGDIVILNPVITPQPGHPGFVMQNE